MIGLRLLLAMQTICMMRALPQLQKRPVLDLVKECAPEDLHHALLIEPEQADEENCQAADDHTL